MGRGGGREGGEGEKGRGGEGWEKRGEEREGREREGERRGVAQVHFNVCISLTSQQRYNSFIAPILPQNSYEGPNIRSHDPHNKIS